MPIVTISRQVGSWGDEIASVVARRLGYPLIGREQFQKLAENGDPEFKKAFSVPEETGEPASLEQVFFQNPAYTALFESITYELASAGNAVIVGRGAQVVLRETFGVFKARIVAPLDVRVKRIMAQKGVSLEEASDFVSRYDHQRRTLIQVIYRKDLTDWYLYDLILNTSAFDPQGGAEVLCQAIGSIEKPVDEGGLRRRLKELSFAKRVESVIKRWLITSPHRHIEVDALSDGTVTLSGYVQDRDNLVLAERIASGVDGVARVKNDLKITRIRV